MLRQIQLSALARYTAIGAMLYPVLTVAFLPAHYAITSRDLSERATATLEFASAPIFLLCLFTLLIAFRSEGPQRKAGVVCSLLGGVLNLLLLVFALVAVGA